jgi:hypothetical protein
LYGILNLADLSLSPVNLLSRELRSLDNSPYAEDLETLTPDPSPSGRGEKSPSRGCAPATLVYKPKYRLKEIRIPRNIS